MMIDTNQRLEIEASPWKLLGLGVGSASVAAFAACLAFGVVPYGPADASYAQVLCFAAAFFAGICAPVLWWRALTARSTVVIMTPDGIRDSRVATDFIPWTAILHISTWTHSGQKIMVIAVDPEVENRLALTPVARVTRGANRSLSIDGLCVTAHGLKVSYEDLLRTCMAYATAAHARQPAYDPA